MLLAQTNQPCCSHKQITHPSNVIAHLLLCPVQQQRRPYESRPVSTASVGVSMDEIDALLQDHPPPKQQQQQRSPQVMVTPPSRQQSQQMSLGDIDQLLEQTGPAKLAGVRASNAPPPRQSVAEVFMDAFGMHTHAHAHMPMRTHAHAHTCPWTHLRTHMLMPTCPCTHFCTYCTDHLAKVLLRC